MAQAPGQWQRALPAARTGNRSQARREVCTACCTPARWSAVCPRASPGALERARTAPKPPPRAARRAPGRPRALRDRPRQPPGRPGLPSRRSERSQAPVTVAAVALLPLTYVENAKVQALAKPARPCPFPTRALRYRRRPSMTGRAGTRGRRATPAVDFAHSADAMRAALDRRQPAGSAGCATRAVATTYGPSGRMATLAPGCCASRSRSAAATDVTGCRWAARSCASLRPPQ